MIIYSKVVIDMKSGEIREQVGTEYSGPVALCKGATHEQKDLQAAQAAQYRQINEEAASRFKDQTAVLQQLQTLAANIYTKGPNQWGITPAMMDTMISKSEGAARDSIIKNFAKMDNVMDPMFAKGPGQFGYTPGQESAMRASAAETVTGASKMEREATAEQLAAQGGNVGTPSGVQAQLRAQQNAAEAAGLSKANLDITKEGYAQGEKNFALASDYEKAKAGTLSAFDAEAAKDELALYKSSADSGMTNYWNAANLLGSVAQIQNPIGTNTAATDAGGAAGKTASEVEQANAAGWKNVSNVLSAGLGAGGQILQGKCWIARELWGDDSGKTKRFRHWLNEIAPHSFFGNIFYRLYCRFGERIAEHIKTHPFARRVVSSIMETVYPYAASRVYELKLKTA
jgi:hypothetical protein